MLGPLLFLIYVNDFPLKIKKAILDKFADDTTVSKSGSLVEQVTDDLNEEMANAVNWFDNNHMSVNIGKTKAFFVSSAQKQSCIQEDAPEIKVGTTIPEVSNKEKLLRVTIDNTLNWSVQVYATIKSVTPSCFFLVGSKYIWIYQQGSYFSIRTFFHIWTTAILFGETAVMSFLTELLSFRKELQDWFLTRTSAPHLQNSSNSLGGWGLMKGSTIRKVY